VTPEERARRVLWRIRMAHTVIWAVFSLLIVAIPVLAAAGRLKWALGFSLVVWGEVIVIAANKLHCPLRQLAARYTADRSDGFDIFLPAWLARRNLTIFGALFALSQIVLLWRFARG
jgi:hypothetical protein